MVDKSFGALAPNQRQVERAMLCPNNCRPSMVIHAMPKVLGDIADAHSRCMVCMTYWRTKPSGLIAEMHRPFGFYVCPKCLQYTEKPWPVETTPARMCQCSPEGS